MKPIFSRLLALGLTLSLAAVPASALELDTARELLDTYYVEGVPDDVLALDSLDEILEALGDPYTYYMDSDQYQNFLESVNGQVVVGIGVSIETAYHDGYQIMSILPDSPALEVGLQPGDRLVAVDGVELTGSLDPRVAIAGEEGSSVTVTVVRGEERLDFTMARRSVAIPIVTYELVDGAAYIDCSSFGSSTPSTFRAALEELEDDTAVWIVDLRSNPGGDSDSTALSAGYFTGSHIMLYFRDSSGNYYQTYLAENYPDLTDKPVIILTSSHSASGSELFAGDIRDYGAGIAVGQRTFGKGTAQLVFNERNAAGFSDGEAMKITVYRFFSPNGATNHIVGVLPTLLTSQENTAQVALLLSQDKPRRAEGYVKLELAGQTFYLDPEKAAGDTAAAFTELLEALPPSAALYQGSGTQVWTEVTPAQLALELGLDGYSPRGDFSDISSSAFQREIRTLATYGLLGGFEDGTFRPQSTVTRAQFCAMVATALDLPAGQRTFSDVAGDAWYAGAVSAMADMGFLSGYGDGTFRPDATITQEQMAVILSAVAQWASMEGYELAQTGLTAQDLLTYYDYADWAQTAARNLGTMEALAGDLAPGDSVTREVAAASLCRLMEHIGLLWD